MLGIPPSYYCKFETSYTYTFLLRYISKTKLFKECSCYSMFWYSYAFTTKSPFIKFAANQQQVKIFIEKYKTIFIYNAIYLPFALRTCISVDETYILVYIWPNKKDKPDVQFIKSFVAHLAFVRWDFPTTKLLLRDIFSSNGLVFDINIIKSFFQLVFANIVYIWMYTPGKKNYVIGNVCYVIFIKYTYVKRRR